MMNDRTMTGPRRCDTEWPQTRVLYTRAERQRSHAYRQKPAREPINWGRCLMVAGAVFLVALTFIVKMTGPA